MRLFFAVLLPEEVVARVREAQETLRACVGDDGVRWTRPEQFHYTLKFLGEIPPPRAYKAVEAAQAACAEQEPFEVVLGGVGAFPNERRPSTLWLGATAGEEPMAVLADRLEQALAKQGFPRENRPFRAHLTLARIKSYAGEMAAARALQEVEVGEVGRAEARALALMQSTLKPSGSEYQVVEKFAFIE